MTAEPYEIVAPFVVCESEGGPFEDQAYVAGFEMGRLDSLLAGGLTTQRRVISVIHTANVPQADLIAMRHGWTLTTEDQDDGWSTAVLER